MKRFILMAVAGLGLALSAHASTLLLNVDITEFQEDRAPESAILTDILVGGSNVNIGSFGTFGQMLGDGNVKWVIFDGSHNLVFSTLAVAQSTAVSSQWYDAPSFSFTLLANSTYYLGLIADQGFEYNYGVSGGDISANGLTAPSAANGFNGNAVDFASPAWNGIGTVQQSVRIYDVDAPEPTSVVLLGSGLAGLGLIARRRKRSTLVS